MEIRYELNDLSQVAIDLIKIIEERNYTIIEFRGAMGMGKTTLIKEICRQMGVQDNVSSPTFSIVNEYRLPSGRECYHFDFYRINSVEEVFDLGYEDYFYSGDLCLIEWPELVEDILPSNLGDDSVKTLRLAIDSCDGGGRTLKIL